MGFNSGFKGLSNIAMEFLDKTLTNFKLQNIKMTIYVGNTIVIFMQGMSHSNDDTTHSQ